jgi:hypothetical protein
MDTNSSVLVAQGGSGYPVEGLETVRVKMPFTLTTRKVYVYKVERSTGNEAYLPQMTDIDKTVFRSVQNTASPFHIGFRPTVITLSAVQKDWLSRSPHAPETTTLGDIQ